MSFELAAALVIVALVYIRPRKHPRYYSSKLTQEDLEQVRSAVQAVLMNYPDALVGKDFPDIKYQVLTELYDTGKITREVYDAEIEIIIKNIYI